MKFSAWILSVLAALAMVVVPITPSAAASGGAAQQALAQQAEKGNIGILSRTQVDALARSNPKLHAKLMDAYHASATPKLSAPEKRYVDRLTKKNLSEFKAGSPAVAPLIASGAWLSGAGWLVFAFILIVGVIILWNLLTRGVAARPAM